MRTVDRLAAVDASMDLMRATVPVLPMADVTLMRLIRVASFGITACIDAPLRPAGLTESSYHTLIVIMSGGAEGISVGELCDQVGQARANMTRIIALLCRRGLTVTHADAHDHRRKYVVITPAGAELTRAYASRLAPVIASALRGLSAHDKKALDRSLRALVASMDKTERLCSRAAD